MIGRIFWSLDRRTVLIENEIGKLLVDGDGDRVDLSGHA